MYLTHDQVGIVARTLVSTLIIMAFGIRAEAGERCPTNASGPDICVAFAVGTPDILDDFTVDYVTDPANPSVTLISGNLTWNVRSDDNGNPGNIGAITIPIEPQATDNFVVKIANGANAGAVNVGSIVLKSGGSTWPGYSAIADGSEITGDLYRRPSSASDQPGRSGRKPDAFVDVTRMIDIVIRCR